MKLDRRLIILLESQRLLFSLVILAGFLGGIIIVIQARLLSRIVNLVFLFQSTLSEVSYLLDVLLLVIILRALLVWVGEFTANHLSVRIKTKLRIRLYDHISHLGPGFIKQETRKGGVRTGELVNVVNQGIESLEAYFSQYLPQLGLAVLIPLTILVVILPVDTLSGFILLLTAPLIPLFMVLIGDLANTLTRRQWSTLSRMSAYFLDVLQGLTMLKIFGRSTAQIRQIAQIGDQYRSTTMSVLRITFLSALVLELVATLSTAVVAVEIGLRLLYGRLYFEEALFILLLAPEFFQPLRLLGTRFHAGMAGVAAAERIFEILSIQPHSPNSIEHLNVPPENSIFPYTRPVSISLEKVHFSYSVGQAALNGITFNMPAGKTIAIIGPSGAGKSTITDLLLGFIQPTQGQILVNGRPLTSIRSSEWMDQVSWLPQDPYLFNASIADNIRLGLPDASQEQVVEAARNAYAHEFILSLPAGYETQIGERGVRLSAGQTQRLALARALLKPAPFLILDEAASHLDPDAASKINAAIQDLRAKRTTLVIAHNLSTLQQADQIVVLDQGQVVESGTHKELLSKQGFYWCMVTRELLAEPSPIPPIQPSRESPEKLAASPAVDDSIYPLSLDSLFSLLRLLPPYKWLVLLSVLLGWATVASGVGLLATSAYLISAAALQPSIAALQVPIVAVRAFGLTRGVFRYLERYVSHDTTFRLLARLRVWFYRVLEPLAPARLMQYQSGDLLSRIHQDINSLEDFYVRVVSPPLVWLLVTLSTSILMACFSLQLGLTLLIFQILAGLVVPVIVRITSRNPGTQLVADRARLSTVLVDSIQGLPDLQVFNVSGRQKSSLVRISNAIAAAQSRLGFISGVESALGNLLANLASWSVLFLSIPLITAGQIEAVYLGTLILAALASFEASNPLPQAARSLVSSLAAADRLEQVISTRPEVQDPATPLPVPQHPGLVIEDLRFSYPPLLDSQRISTSTLNGIDFELPAGKRLALTGPSGAGKTTLANLLLRFWDYKEGHIKIGNQEISTFTQDEIRDLIAVVSQRTHLFNASLRDNLLLARPDADEDEIIGACMAAQIHEFITTLPEGYDTWIGEGGLRLSGGERQRVAIARALLKDAPFLILDEATANLDLVTERELLASLFSLTEGRTTLWITHRLVGMQSMDEILVMSEGEIIERGEHTQLLNFGGLYRRMWDLQHNII